MDYLITLGLLLAAYAGMWVVNALMSIRNSIFQEGYTFDKKYFLQGFIKALIVLVAMGTGGFILLQVPMLLDRLGITLANGMAEAISLVGIAAAVAAGLFTQAKKFRENVSDLFNKEDIKFDLKLDAEDFNKGLAIFDPATIEVSDDYVQKKIAEEEAADTGEVGGTGAQYSVNISSYAAFKKAVLGKGFDIDGYYGWQCWDGAALLWQQKGKALVTGNGLAIGAWDLKRNSNTYGLFDLVYKAGELKLGDVVFMRPNHVGFFDGWDGQYMKILGQNQGVGKTNPNGGSVFTVVRVHQSAFAGAMRFKAWNKKAPAPKPSTAKPDYKVVKTIKGYINAANAKARKNSNSTVPAGTYFTFSNSNGMRNISRKKGVPGWWINPADNKASKPAPKPAAKKYVTVKKGWGLSNVAKAAGFKDFNKSSRWAAIAKLNGSSNWQKFNNSLKPNQKVRVK